MNYSLIDNMKISTIALGGNIFGYNCDRVETCRVLAAAEETGINFLDTADVYGQGISEEYIGEWLRERRNLWVVASKIGLESGKDPSGLGRASSIRKKIEGSLKRLKTDYIDIYQLHHFDPVTPIEETLEEVTKLRSEGKIRYFGLSNISGRGLRKFAGQAINCDKIAPATVQAHFSVFCRNAEADLFPACVELSVPVLAYGVLARGVLSGKYTSDRVTDLPLGSRASHSARVRDDLTKQTLRSVEKIGECARTLGLSTAQLSVAYALSKNPIATVVVGIRNELQLVDLAKTIDTRLTDTQVRLLEDFAVAGAPHPLGFGAPVIYG